MLRRFGTKLAIFVTFLCAITVGRAELRQPDQQDFSRLDLDLSKTAVYINAGDDAVLRVVLDNEWIPWKPRSGEHESATLQRFGVSGRECQLDCATLLIAGPLDADYLSRVSSDGTSLTGEECAFGEPSALSNPELMSRERLPDGTEVILYQAYECGSDADILEWFVPAKQILIRELPSTGSAGLVTQKGGLPAGLAFS